MTNYLEVVGGSNFGVQADNPPDWHKHRHSDAATPAIDMTNETSGPPGVLSLDGKQSIAAATNISGKTIADQLAAIGRKWKSYQESHAGADARSHHRQRRPDFRSIQEGDEPGSSLDNSVGFDGPNGLYADLRAGTVPDYSFVAPNQCNVWLWSQRQRRASGPESGFDSARRYHSAIHLSLLRPIEGGLTYWKAMLSRFGCSFLASTGSIFTRSPQFARV